MFTGVQILAPRALDAMPARGCIIRTAYRQWVESQARASDGPGLVRGHITTVPFYDLGTKDAYLEGHLRALESSESQVHPSANVHPDAKLERCWIGADAQIGPVTLRECVVWDGARADRDAERSIITRRFIETL